MANDMASILALFCNLDIRFAPIIWFFKISLIFPPANLKFLSVIRESVIFRKMGSELYKLFYKLLFLFQFLPNLGASFKAVLIDFKRPLNGVEKKYNLFGPESVDSTPYLSRTISLTG